MKNVMITAVLCIALMMFFGCGDEGTLPTPTMPIEGGWGHGFLAGAPGRPSDVLWGTNIRLPAKGVGSFDVLWLYGFDTYKSSSSGNPELLTDFAIYESESGTKPLKAVFDKHIPSADSTGLTYFAFVLDDVIAITYFGEIGGVESTMSQSIYHLPADRLNQDVEIEWDLWNNEWAEESPNWQLHADEGSHVYSGYKILPSYIEGVEAYRSRSEGKPLKLYLQVMMRGETTELERSTFEFRTLGEYLVFRLYYGEYGEPKEFVQQWFFQIPPHDSHVGIDVGIDFRDASRE